MRYWRRNWIVIVAIIVHGFWGIVLLFNPAPLNCTPLASLKPLGQYRASFVLLTATGLAILHYLIHEKIDLRVGLWLLSLQQMLLMSSASTAVFAVIVGSYPDGTVVPSLHILCDQWWTIVGMIGHTFSLIDWFWWSTWKIKE